MGRGFMSWKGWIKLAGFIRRRADGERERGEFGMESVRL